MLCTLRNSLTLGLALVLASLCAGCTSTSSCNRTEDSETISDGLVFGNTYISAPNNAAQRGPWAHFPPQRTLVFEHHLDGVPYQITIWLAFQEVGTLAPSAGNLSIRKHTPDDKTIAIKNDTCSEYWAWVEASLPVYTGFDSASGASGASGADVSDAAGASGAP